MSIESIRLSIKEAEESLSAINSYLDDHDEYTQNPLVEIQHAILTHVWLILNEQQNTIEDLYRRVYKIPNSPTGVMVRNLRDDLGLSQADLAVELGVTRESVCRWESGRYAMTDINKEKIRKYTNNNKKEQ